MGIKSCQAACVALLVTTGAWAAERSNGAPLTVFPGLTTGAPRPQVSAFSRGLQALRSKDYTAALELFEDAVAGARIDVTPIGWLTAQYQVCQTLNLLGRRTEAVARARQVAESCETTLGGEDPVTSEALAYLAFLLKQNGRLTEAEPVYLRNLAGLVDKHGADSFFAACARTRLADLLMQMGRMDEAENHHRQALAAAQTALGQEHADNCFFLTHLGYCLHVSQKKPEAAELMERAFHIVKSSPQQGEGMSHQVSILRRQAEFFRDIRQLDKARLTGRLCLQRLAARGESSRVSFFFYDRVRQLYHSILAADGLKPHEIKIHLAEVETQGR